MQTGEDEHPRRKGDHRALESFLGDAWEITVAVREWGGWAGGERTEYGDDVLLVAPVEALHDQLVRPRHQLQPVCVVELRGVPQQITETVDTR